MTVFTIKKGLDIKISGKPELTLETAPVSKLVALRPVEFLGSKPKLLVKEGDRVKVGQALFFSKVIPAVKFGSPGGGIVKEIRRGKRRVITQLVIEREQEEEWENFGSWDESKLSSASASDIKDFILNAGFWPVIRQRPFGKIADPQQLPKAIFINGMATEPLDCDPSIAIDNRESEVQSGVNILKKLTKGNVYLTLNGNRKAPAILSNIQNATSHHFKGPHPSGLVGTHIRYIDPIKPGEVVWYLSVADVIAIAELFKTGKYPVHRIIALSGEGVTAPKHYKIRRGAQLSTLLDGNVQTGEYRYISGSILSGTEVDNDGFFGFYDTVCTVIPNAYKRDFMGWAMPGWKKYSIFNSFGSCLMLRKQYNLDTRLNGGVRPIVNIGAWEKMFPIDIHLSYLIRAVLAEDIEEAESLGLLELTEEDVALCTFACPSKMELGEIIRMGLDLYEKEVL